MRSKLAMLVGAVGLVVSMGAQAADGKAVYDSKCSACHAQGIAGAPKFGDKAAWEPRIKLGEDVLIQSVVKGKNAMPPRAGQNVNDADIKVAVEYMVSKAK